MNWNAYWRLMRFHKPVGTLLLWFPTAWALWIANKGMPSLRLLALFFIGTVLMRAAGCVMNDIADRNIDKHVYRTQTRPLTSGEVHLFEALVLLFSLLLGAFLVLMLLPQGCVAIAIVALLITIIYPFCKRFLNAPQFVLGLAFSMGIPMVYIASGVPFDWQMVVLFILNFAWIVAYDTMYAMTDKADDLRIGVKSTAIYFANYDLLIIASLLILLHSLWFYWATSFQANLGFYVVWIIAGNLLIYQQYLISERKPELCFKGFLTSAYYGGLMWLAVMLA